MLNPTVDTNDIICTTAGRITVGGVPPSGYEYSLIRVIINFYHKYSRVPILHQTEGVATNPCILK
jgi:hypothetical protein